MNLLTYAVPAAALCLASTWASVSLLRPRRDLAALRDRIEGGLATTLYPFVAPRMSYATCSDDELWKVLGGVAGILRLHHDAGLLVTLGFEMRRSLPVDQKRLGREIFWAAIYLRITTWFCVAESVAACVIPLLPRVQARSCARLYCDILTTADVVMSM